jgi:hypothetical protein
MLDWVMTAEDLAPIDCAASSITTRGRMTAEYTFPLKLPGRGGAPALPLGRYMMGPAHPVRGPSALQYVRRPRLRRPNTFTLATGRRIEHATHVWPSPVDHRWYKGARNELASLRAMSETTRIYYGLESYRMILPDPS